jgi:hypothetical protein
MTAPVAGHAIRRSRHKCWLHAIRRPRSGRRGNAVSADSEIGHLGAAVIKDDDDLIAGLTDAIDPPTEDVGAVRHPVPERPVEVIPGYLHLRGHFGIDGRSHMVEHNAFTGHNANARDVLAPRGAKNSEGVSLAQQAGSATLQPVHRPFVDRNLVAVAGEQTSRE